MFSGSFDRPTMAHRATYRIEMLNSHLNPRNVLAPQAGTALHSPSTTDSSSVHFGTSLPSRPLPPITSALWQADVAGPARLPPCDELARWADTGSLRYVRAPSVGNEYVAVPLVKTEAMHGNYGSPIESVLEESVSPSSSASNSPTMFAPAIHSGPQRGRRRTGSPQPSGKRFRVTKNAKSSKQKDLSAVASRLDNENNKRLEKIHSRFKDGQSPCVNGPGGSSMFRPPQAFPVFRGSQEPRPAKHAITTTGSSDANERHNVAQTVLRGEKGCNRMTLERLLVGPLGWGRGSKLQTKVNARSSGMLYEEKEVLQGSTQLTSLAIIFFQKLFGENIKFVGDVLPLFDVEEVRPETVVREAEDDDKTFEFKRHAAKIDVIDQVTQPLALKNIQSEDELSRVIQEHLMPLATAKGKEFLRTCIREVKEVQAKM